jgi:hypothetical protein
LSDRNFRIEDFILLGKFATKQIRLEHIDRDILECFIQYPGIWAYRIYKDREKLLGKYVDERTIRRCVSRLSDIGLIDSDEKQNKGKKLSTCGIYYLFLNIQRGMLDNLTFKAILKNYGENILFQLFLYPYLDRETLLGGTSKLL